MDRLGREVGRAIKGNQKLIPKDPETVAQMVLFQALKDLEKDGVEMARGNRIEEGVTGCVKMLGNGRFENAGCKG